MGLSDEDVREILRIIDESGLDELVLDMPDLSLHVRRNSAATSAPAAPPSSLIPPRPTPDSVTPPAPAGGSQPASGEGDSTAPQPNGALLVEAPMLGTFYRAEAPGDPPFAGVGDRVEPDSVVCLIEVMKLMNHIQAGVSGTIVEVLADNATLVEFGQPLFRVDPAR
jgi:acetyl-CoA carboxylase biotin carboxyl carrier protein